MSEMQRAYHVDQSRRLERKKGYMKLFFGLSLMVAAGLIGFVGLFVFLWLLTLIAS